MPQGLTLDKISPGGKARIVAINGGGTVRRRMVEMGLTPGAVVEVKRVAPLGDPLDILVKGYRLSIRKEEAFGIAVTPCDDTGS